MGNARTETAKRGWEIYRTSVPRPSLIVINATLNAEGVEAVSDRTWRHYRRLDDHGAKEYMPINELDVRLKADRLLKAG